MKSPQIVQLSQLRAPVIRRGRAYTVDYGLAKPLPTQLLSYLSDQATLGWTRLSSSKLRLIAGLIVFYVALLLPFSGPPKIVYADPMLTNTKPVVLAKLTMPSLSPQEPLEPLPPPITLPSPVSSFANSYAPGNCTWYVASRIPVPNDWGNAITWGYAAQAAGYEVSDIPRAGAIAWSIGDSYLGHVAIVESVGDVVMISEMNAQGLGVVDSRPANPGEFRYIYL